MAHSLWAELPREEEERMERSRNAKLNQQSTAIGDVTTHDSVYSRSIRSSAQEGTNRGISALRFAIVPLALIPISFPYHSHIMYSLL